MIGPGMKNNTEHYRYLKKISIVIQLEYLGRFFFSITFTLRGFICPDKNIGFKT